ncbi:MULTISPECIES: TetR/AcrR family transcriptional regulator [unclassified Streptomyces]|uniref:TetR/AcrR family transcriptional regulator n=1 Tax=unclassified Streptomyces TaxID=2593676 RepID=UPI0005ECE635|nr:MULTISPECIES: TetR/AcrR family transcriptional regulator [unclassified Streptomyces]APU38863.1 TetR family transcriptional regulator [Streptomyces sp. TN58]KJK47722.1 TetR family transcriptional regulator [Streptomyces sp. NRRL F-4428]
MSPQAPGQAPDPGEQDPRPRPEDPRTARTRARLRESLLAQCAGRPLAEISVSAVARRAGVGRATFYLHYDDLTALAVDACADVVHAAVDALHAWQADPSPLPPARPPAALAEFLTGAAERAPLYRGLLLPGGSGPLGDRLHRELRARARAERAAVGAPQPELVASAVAATFTGVLADWLHGEVPADPAALADHLWPLLLALHRAVRPQ